MKVIVAGSGGREHAIAWALSKSPLVEEVLVCPGNGGTERERKCRNAQGNAIDIALTEHCALAVIGPEVPLAEGMADEFRAAGIPCVGASKKAARLESSKDYAKSFMKRYGVSAPSSETFNDASSAKEYVKKHGAPIVIKADGLAAGKGVTVAATVLDALDAIDDIMLSDRLGGAGSAIVIEDYLEGVEMSVLAAVSVKGGEGIILPFLPARDHKRLLDGALGPNTGGMGAVCPLPDVDIITMAAFDKDILQPTLEGLKAESAADVSFDYRGFIFFGVMITATGPKLLEYNVRLGDPETQAVLPLMQSDFAVLCDAIAGGTLKQKHEADSKFIKWRSGFVASPCVVSSGYPNEYEIGKAITFDDGVFGIKAIEGGGDNCDAPKLFIAGAKNKDGTLITSGGRVLCLSAYGKTFDEARDAAYKAIKAVHFDGAFYRKDIGLPGAAVSGRLCR